MNSLNFFDMLGAVILGNSAIVALIFTFMRLRQRNVWDAYSAGASLYAAAILFVAGYFAS